MRGKVGYLKTPILFLIFIPIIYVLTWFSSVDALYNFNIQKLLDIDVVTIVIIVIMFLILLFDAIFARKKLTELTTALKNWAEEGAEISNQHLEKGWDEYFYAKSKIKKGVGVVPDISDYINEQTIADYVHREITDQIANAMTGLGILGTFIGLTMGLENFNSQEAIASTPVLLNGIKVAFYTSIFGVIASIIYNHFYHEDIEKCNLALEKFYSAFNDRIAPPTEVDFYNKMLVYNREQRESLDKLATAIGDEMVKKFDHAIQTSINAYIVEAVNSQSESLQKIVDNFMKQLNEALDNQFHNLSRSIKDMCEWQDDSTEKLKSIMGSLKNLTEDMSKINVDIEEAELKRKQMNESTYGVIDRAKHYADAFKEYSEIVNKWTNELQSDVQDKMDYNRQLKELLEEQNTQKIDLLNQFNTMVEEFKDYKEKIDTVLNAHKEDDTKLFERAEKIITSLAEENKRNALSNDKFIQSVNGLIKEMQTTWDKHSKSMKLLANESNTREGWKFGFDFITKSRTAAYETSDENKKDKGKRGTEE